MSRTSSDQTFLITGASSGIGQQVAYKAAAAGANLILCARRTSKLKEVKRHCEELGARKIFLFPLDIGQAAEIDQLMIFLKRHQLQVDILINNAGFGYEASFAETNFEVVVDLFKVNVLGLMYLTQQIVLSMLEAGKGQIINVASLAGKVSTPHYAAYDATKAAVISFSNALRMELKSLNIPVTVVNFGPVNTPFFEHIGKKRKKQALANPFTLTAKQAGKIVFDTVGTKKREVNRPVSLAIGAKIYPFAPQLVDYLLVKYYNR